MKHLTFADKTMFIGDEAADLLMQYAAALARASDGDSVTVAAYSAEGNAVTATLLLDSGAPIMVETTEFASGEPDNDEVSDYMRTRLMELADSTAASPEDQGMGRSPAFEPGTLDFE